MTDDRPISFPMRDEGGGFVICRLTLKEAEKLRDWLSRQLAQDHGTHPAARAALSVEAATMGNGQWRDRGADS